MKRRQKFVYLAALCFNTAVTAGIYIFANMREFLPIMWIYNIAVCILACAFLYLYMKDKVSEADNAEKDNGGDSRKRKKRMKILLLFLMPFLIVLLCDYTYVLFLSQDEFFSKIINLFK